MTNPQLAFLARRLSPFGALLVLGLLSCGRTGAGPGGTGGGAGGGRNGNGGGGGTSAAGGGTGGAPASGGGGAAAAGGGAGAGGGGGAGPAVDVSGRWGLFVFEDPVGVLLVQAADGSITGQGCSAGAPGSTGPTEPGVPVSCGPLHGRVSGRSVSFGFTSDFAFTYITDVVVSDDVQRMAGRLSTQGFELRNPVAWRRVQEDAVWLDRGKLSRPDPMLGSYDLTLIPEESVGSEFVVGTTYQIRYQDHTIAGQLGSFWTDEISPLNGGSPLRVGPVPTTSAALPTSLGLDFDNTGFTGISVDTPAGGHYRFAIRLAGP